MRPMRRGRSCVVAVTPALVLALALAGCGSVSVDYEETGIDGLTIPTPAPDPEDFVGEVDNPWLPLVPGSTWTYDVDEGAVDGERSVTVEPSNLRLAGVAVTVVRTETVLGDGPAAETTDYYAQDRDGNVWWFGRQGVWDVEVAGAEAGLAMPRRPPHRRRVAARAARGRGRGPGDRAERLRRRGGAARRERPRPGSRGGARLRRRGRPHEDLRPRGTGELERPDVRSLTRGPRAAAGTARAASTPARRGPTASRPG